jgi:hypothetical protein
MPHCFGKAPTPQKKLKTTSHGRHSLLGNMTQGNGKLNTIIKYTKQDIFIKQRISKLNS